MKLKSSLLSPRIWAHSLEHADATFDDRHTAILPTLDDWVLVLGAHSGAGHWPLADVFDGERIAFDGLVSEVIRTDDSLLIRPTGDVLAEVVQQFSRVAPEVLDVEIKHVDGAVDTLTATPNHPFWVEFAGSGRNVAGELKAPSAAVREYVPLGELEVGAVLHVQGGGEAILVSKTWRQGDFKVFDFEVEGLHNFYVRGSGIDAAGVLVHNSVNLDTGSAIAFVSEGSPARHGMKAAVGDRRMVMTETAAAEFQGALRAAGPSERARAARLMGRVDVVPDNPSAKAIGLTETKKVGANDKIIFGTGDTMGVPTMTSDAKFLRGASAQGVEFDSILHNPVPLTGQ